jgi:hypothetical protein
VSQFKGSHKALTKAEVKKYRDALSQAKSWEGWEELAGGWDEEGNELDEVRNVVDGREANAQMRFAPPELPDDVDRGEEQMDYPDGDETEGEQTPSSPCTPTGQRNPFPLTPWAPLGPRNESLMRVPAGVSGRDEVTPTPCPNISSMGKFSGTDTNGVFA